MLQPASFSDNMSNFNQNSDFAAFCQWKQWESEHRPQQTARTQQSQRPPQGPSPTRSQNRQALPQYPTELSVLFRYLHELKKRVDEIYTLLHNLQTVSEETKSSLVENMERMHGNLERFEVFGRSVLNKVSQSSNSSSSQAEASSNPPPLTQHPSQQQNSNPPPFGQYTSQQQGVSFQPHNQYGEGLNASQPASTFVPSSNAPQSSYAPPPSQGSDPYTDPNYIDYNVFSEFLASDG